MVLTMLFDTFGQHETLWVNGEKEIQSRIHSHAETCTTPDLVSFVDSLVDIKNHDKRERFV